MSSTSENNKRIAKNTAMLYIRMLLIMAVTLYTSRVVLEVLGVEDFGIYNIVGGVVVLFSFINNAMATATQRFLNFELGRNDIKEVGRVFSMSMTAHISIALLVLLLAETIGLWFLLTQMNIPDGRMNAAVWCYQFSILTTCVQIIRVPYNACIIAYERMSFYAYISILEVILKLLIVFLLSIGGFDKLILYSILMFLVTVAVCYAYKIVCNRNFNISRYSFFWDKTLYKKLMSFSGWSLFGSAANVGAQQGLNILLNIFCGVTVNAAMGIANQVSHAVYSFVSNFQVAFNPQIVKSYASGDKAYFERLIFQASKFSFFLLFIISLPFLLKCDFVLSVWLKEVPEYAVPFTQLILIFLMIDAISAPLWISVQAMGNIRNYQILMGFLILLNLPLGYLVLYCGLKPESVLVIRVLINLIAYLLRLIFINGFISFHVFKYIKNVIAVILLVVILSVPIPLYVANLYQSFKGFVFTFVFSVLSVVVSIYFVGLTNGEKKYIRTTIGIAYSKIRKVYL